MSAITFTDQSDRPIELTLEDVCGESVYLSGVIHQIFHVTQNDNQTVVKMQFRPEGLIGTGLTSGVKYHAVGVTEGTVRFVEDLPIVATAVNNFRMISDGSTDNLQIHETLHLTINANGDTIIDSVKSSTECNG